MLENFLSNFRKPKGIVGGFLCDLMNIGHGKMIRSVLDGLNVQPGETVLDVGCGGGLALALMADKGARAYGIDYSETSVRKARQKNAVPIKAGHMQIEVMNVASLDFQENMFDLVTAFETIYFWPSAEKGLYGIFRSLKPGGRVAVAVEAWKNGDQPVHCPKFLHSLNLALYNKEELSGLLENCGFQDISCSVDKSESWMTAVAFKP